MTKKMVDITAEPLTSEAFTEFGDVIEADKKSANHFSINNGAIERFNDLAFIDIDTDTDTDIRAGRTLINIAICHYATALPFHISMLERHPLGSQAFMPLDNIPMIVVVAPEGELVGPSDIRAFVSNGYQGVNYRRNIWHMPMTPLEAGARLLMIDRGGEGDNCEEFEFADVEIVIHWEQSQNL